MDVKVITATERPMEVIANAAGTSYGKDDTATRRVRTCFDNGHMGVFEHASFTVRIEGISRACSHQLVRHRMASFVQESQRYVKIDPFGDWYVVPPSIERGSGYLRSAYHSKMGACAGAYVAALDRGIKPEDARYLLPEATKTTVTMTMNVRELFHFLDLRTAPAAQWEIRNLALALFHALCENGGQWGKLMIMWQSANMPACKEVEA